MFKKEKTLKEYITISASTRHLEVAAGVVKQRHAVAGCDVTAVGHVDVRTRRGDILEVHPQRQSVTCIPHTHRVLEFASWTSAPAHDA